MFEKQTCKSMKYNRGPQSRLPQLQTHSFSTRLSETHIGGERYPLQQMQLEELDRRIPVEE